MSRKLLFPILILLPLASCSTAADKAQQFTGVPLEDWPAKDQQAAGKLIAQRCGNPPVCPSEAVLERATLAYVKLRNLVRAAGKGD